MLTARVYESTDDLGGLRAEWDELAVRNGRPFATPAWTLAWWDSLRPRGAEMRLVLVCEAGELVGVAPLYSSGRAYAPLGGGRAPVELLAKPGFERQVAEAVRTALAEASPRPASVEVEMHKSSPDWAELLGDAWRGGRGAWRLVKSETPVPRIDLGEGFGQWLEAKPARFRREMKRRRRRLEEAGGAFRFATAGSLERDVHTFMRLHRQRRAGQGGTNLTADGIERMLISVGEELIDRDRFRLLSIDLDGETIAARLLLAAGGEVSAWNSGFDEAHSKLSPSMLSILAALEDASERGERAISLGPGGQHYKSSLSDWVDTLYSQVLVLPGATYPLTRLRLAPSQLRVGLSRRLSAKTKRRLRKLVPR